MYNRKTVLQLVSNYIAQQKDNEQCKILKFIKIKIINGIICLVIDDGSCITTCIAI